MTNLTQTALFETIDQTWPAQSFETLGQWTMRLGAGGGKRVSAASLVGEEYDPNQIPLAEDWMVRNGQTKLFMIRPSDSALDQDLKRFGYDIIDPVVILSRPVSGLAKGPDINFENKPTDEQAKIWADGGIGPARLAVMKRTQGARACLSIDGKVTAFAAIHLGTCFVHAVEVRSTARRQGLGRQIMLTAADWARNRGADQIAVLTVKENKAALGLYHSLGFEPFSNYHYRILNERN